MAHRSGLWHRRVPARRGRGRHTAPHSSARPCRHTHTRCQSHCDCVRAVATRGAEVYTRQGEVTALTASRCSSPEPAATSTSTISALPVSAAQCRATHSSCAAKGDRGKHGGRWRGRACRQGSKHGQVGVDVGGALGRWQGNSDATYTGVLVRVGAASLGQSCLHSCHITCSGVVAHVCRLLRRGLDRRGPLGRHCNRSPVRAASGSVAAPLWKAALATPCRGGRRNLCSRYEQGGGQ